MKNDDDNVAHAVLGCFALIIIACVTLIALAGVVWVWRIVLS